MCDSVLILCSSDTSTLWSVSALFMSCTFYSVFSHKALEELRSVLETRMIEHESVKLSDNQKYSGELILSCSL